MIYYSKSVDDTIMLAQKLAENILPGQVVALIGNLGTGKTTFTQGFAKALGIIDRVGSPTFKLVSEYLGSEYWLYHLDAYRLEGVNDFFNIGGERYLKPDRAVTLIEWADRLSEILTEDIIYIRFFIVDNNMNKRKIEIEGIEINV